MISDNTTFYLAFTAVFLGLAAYLWHLERKARCLEDRIDDLEATRAPVAAEEARAANEKSGHVPPPPKP